MYYWRKLANWVSISFSLKEKIRYSRYSLASFRETVYNAFRNIWSLLYQQLRCFKVSFTLSLTECKAKVDLAFLLDGSDRIDYQKEGNFKKCQEFIKALVSSYNIGKDGTNVGLVLFYKTSEVVFEFEKYLDVTSLTQAIDTIPYPNKGSNIGIGLDLVKSGLFDVSARQGVRTVLIVITGGSSQVCEY